MRLKQDGLRVWLMCLSAACAQGCAQGTATEPLFDRIDELPDADVSDDQPSDDADVDRDASSERDASARDAAATEDATAHDAAASDVDGATEPVRDASARDAQSGAADAGVDAARADAGGSGTDGFSYSPSNVALPLGELTSAPSAQLSCGTTQIDTSGAVTFSNWCGTRPTPVVRTQSGGPELVIIPLKGLTLASGNTLRVVGPRPVVFVVQGAATIAGALDVAARSEVAGAGGNWMCAASQGGQGSGNSGLAGAGGGGGGFATRGGAGGSDLGANAGAAGSERGTSELVPLLAGCGGGQAGGCAGNPGAGGGAVQISASAGLIVSGSINANGGVGARGCGNDSGGTGGGSGGSILLEGDALNITGADLSVIGGGGGEAQGGNAGGGGASAVGAQGAAGRNGNGSGGGGGGGGYGRVRLRGLKSCTGC